MTLKKSSAFIAVGLCLFFFAYCSKFNTTEIGSNIVTNFNTDLNIKDTLIEVETQTTLATDTDTSKYAYYFDASSNNLLGAVLGKYQDNSFGTKTGALFFTTIRNGSTANPFSGTGIVLDSITLRLKAITFYGDTVNNLSFNIYKLADTLRSATSGYYKFSDNPAHDASTLMTNIKFSYPYLNNSAGTNQINIPLPSSFGNEFINAPSSTWDALINFKNFFKGLAIIPDKTNPTNAFVNINPLDSGTYIKLYYSSTESGASATTQKTIKFYVDINYAGVANHLAWDKSAAVVNTYLNDNGTNQDAIFLQTNPRLKVKINLKNLSGLNPNALIYKAELVAKEIYENDLLNSTKIAPRFLFAYIDSGDNRYAPVPKDYSTYQNFSNQIAYLQGYRMDTVDANSKKIAMYKFNISRYVQGIINQQQTNFPLVISAFNNAPFTDPYRVYNQIANGMVKLAGGSHIDKTKKMYVRVFYSLQ